MSHIPVPVVRAENHGSNLPGFATPAKRVAPGDIRIWTLALAALLLATAGAQAQAVFGTIAVGGSTPPAEQSVSVTALVGGTVNSVKILTAGASNQDFTAGSGASCVPATPLAAGAACTQSVTFTPAAPGLRIGAVVLLDSSGNVLGTAYLSGTGLGGLGILVPGNILPVAGKDGVYEGPVVNGIPAIQGELNHPSSVTLDGAGNLYIADRYHNMIRMVCASASSATIYGTAAACTGAGIITTIAGNGNPVYTGDTESSLLATLNTPWGVALDGAGNLYIADTQNNAIRKITAATGIISTVAGNISGNVCGEKTDPAGDGCPAISSTLNYPQGVTIDAGGNLYIADTNNHRIRRVDAVSGIITTIAGNGFVNTDGSGGYFGDNGKASLAELNYPFAVAFDSQGNMYIPDSLNNRVRLVTAVSGVVSGNSIITTFAGTGLQGYAGDGDAAATAKMFAPSGVIADPAGNVYIADTQNNAIRKVSSATSSTPGIISTVAVNGVGQYFYNGNFAPISIDGPIGLYLDSGGNLYFADVLKMQIQEIQSNFAALDYLLTPIRQGSKSATQDQTVENDGNAALDLTTINPVQNSALDAAATTCTTGAPYLAVAADCVVGAVFAPSASILPTDPEYGTIDVGKAGDTVNSPLDIELVGIATLVNSTTTTVTSNINPSGFGQSVTFTATVTTGGGTGNLTGTVSFFDGANTLAANVPRNAPPGTTVTATFATAALAVGVHTITATYNAQDAADPTHFSSTSSPYTQTVNESTATNLASSANPSNLGASVTFTATVTIAGGGGIVPDGTVTFMDGTTILGSPALSVAGAATYSTAVLTEGLHSITATYNGDAAKQVMSSTSNTVNQDVQASSGTLVASSLNPSNYGVSVTFTVTVTPGGTAAPTGLVNILDGGAQIAQVSLVEVTGQTTFTTTTLAAGAHHITAAYQGDSNNAPSTSPMITQTVNKTTPTITWAPPAAITYGTALSGTQLDASSNGVAGALLYTPPAGAVLAAGAQTLSVAFTPADTADYNTITATVPLTVNAATPTLVLRTSGTPSSYGAAVTFTATASNGPTGTVTFYDGTNVIGTGALNGNLATFTTSTLTVGPHSITAFWAGAGNYNSVTSNLITQTVNPANSVITWATPAPINYGTALSAAQLDATTTTVGTFTYTPPLGTVLNAGQQTLSVLFTPSDTVDYSTETATVILRVNQVVPVIAWAPPAAITYGTALSGIQLDATSTTTPGAFVYTPPAGTVPTAGAQTLSATFIPTDTTNYSSPTATVPLTVNKATPTLTVNTSGSPSNYGAAVTFTATASTGPTGTVTFYDGTNVIGAGALNGTLATLTISTLTVGPHTISAFWPGNNNFISVTSGSITQTVNVTQTSTTVVSVPNPGIAGTAEAITATVKVIAGAATMTGSVTFTDGTVTLGNANLTAAGTAAINPILAPGPHSIVATYSGDANDNTSASGPYALNVNLATTSTSVTVTPNPTVVQATVTFTATVTGNGAVPTGPVTFNANGTAMGSANLVAGTATFTYSGLAAGTYTITAVYGGDTDDQGSTGTNAAQLVVGTIPTFTDLGFSTSNGALPQTILVATVLNSTGGPTPTPTGTVTFSNGTTVVGSAPLDSSGVATLVSNLATGSYSIIAYYSGDLLHGTSTSPAVTVIVPGSGFNITVNPNPVTMATTQNSTVTVTLSSVDGFADTIGLGCASLPAGVTCHFSSISANLTANETPFPTVQLTIDTNYPLTGDSSTMNTHSENRGAYLAGLFLPFSLFFSWAFWRFRKRYAMVLTTVLVLLLSGTVLLVTGCGGISSSNAAPGTYVIQVTGVGANSDIVHYQNVTLNITQ
jgi:hypothetical protein